jgi:hypothetical protein
MKQLRKRNALVLGVLVTMLAVMSCGKSSGQGQGSSGASSGSTTSKESSSADNNTQTTDTTSQTDTSTTEDTGNTATGEPEADAERWSSEMETLRTAVVTALGDKYWPNAAISPEVLQGTYGVTPELYDDYMGESPMVSVNVDTLIIVKPKEGKAQEVEDTLTAYREAQVESAAQYPRNLGKVQASQVVKIGDYVCFVMLGADSAAEEEASSEAAVTKNEEQDDIAIDAIEKAVQ